MVTRSLLLALRGGAAVAYATALQPAPIQQDMAAYRVTTMIMVPRVLSMFMEALESRVRSEGKETSWRRACRIAERLPMRAGYSSATCSVPLATASDRHTDVCRDQGHRQGSHRAVLRCL
jgi:long-subunit acyl-CoA synthetase (AMP-forming)